MLTILGSGSHLDQTALNLLANDTGGELDPHGADLLGVSRRELEAHCLWRLIYSLAESFGWAGVQVCRVARLPAAAAAADHRPFPALGCLEGTTTPTNRPASGTSRSFFSSASDFRLMSSL